MLRIEKLAGSLGAEIGGIDLGHDPLSPETVATIRRALVDNGVIFFRDQALSSDSYLEFAGRFGEAMEYPFAKGLDSHPRITPVVKLENETINFGGIWHSDTTYLPEPPMATMLLALETPPWGGDTLFASTVAAYEGLSAGMKRMLDGLRVVNSSVKILDRRSRSHGVSNTQTGYSAEHPVIRTHPESGVKTLNLSPGHSLRFRDMTEEESTPLLEYLFSHQIRPEYTCRLTWRPGSLAFWDNRSTLHYAINDYQGQRRVMHRITLAGDRPV